MEGGLRSVNVVVRVRPILPMEIARGLSSSSLRLDHIAGDISVQSNESGRDNVFRTFSFDHVFDEHTAQEEIFRQSRVPELVDAVLEGYHATIFAYGQTGSGMRYLIG